MHFFIMTQHWTKEATYLFAPGLWSSEHQVAKYCSEYRASTGEFVTSNHNFEVIQEKTTVSCNFPEIRLRKIYTTQEVSLFMIPGIVLSSLLEKLGKHILETSNNRYQITISGKPKHGLSINPYFLNLLKLNFGQNLDTQILKNTYEKATQDPELPQDIILYGVSRGAVAAFNFVATEYATMPKKNIKAIILESCFDSLHNMTSFSYFLSLVLPHYDHNGIAPIQPNMIQSFVDICNEYAIPVLFISSLADNRVPYNNSYNLYEQTKKAGLNNVHFVTLHNSIHSGYSHDDPQDTKLYLNAVHQFFKMYGLPYLETFLD